MAEVTVVFADLTGSTGVFESLGNAKATKAITRLTEWIGKVCDARGGRVVKYLGDGVLIMFAQNNNAIEAVTELQRVHRDRIRAWPEQLKMRLKVGMARGDVVEKGGDCFGDAVNLASRLSDLSGPDQIFASELVIDQLEPDSAVRFRALGAMEIRGRSEPCLVHRIEWQNEVLSAFFTMPASLPQPSLAEPAPPPAAIELSRLDLCGSFTSTRLPIVLGRNAESQFLVQDPRVSRQHARIEWRAGKFYLQDLSSYGTWVRFTDNTAIVALRRQECALLLEGEMALGASFDDLNAPIVRFKFTAGQPGNRARNRV